MAQQTGSEASDESEGRPFFEGVQAFDALIGEARASMTGSGAVAVSLGKRQVRRWRAARIVRAEKAWHLGVLLLTTGAVYATGEVIRAVDGSRRGYTAEASRARAERGYEAFRGGFAVGETVHVGWTPIDPDALRKTGVSGPVTIVDNIPYVQWSAAGAPMALARYLAERIALVTDQPPA